MPSFIVLDILLIYETISDINKISLPSKKKSSSVRIESELNYSNVT